MPSASRSVVINAPMDKVFKTITGYEQYAQFLPEVKAIRVTDRAAGKAKVHYEVNVIKTVRYTLSMTEQPPNRVSWDLIEGDFMKENRGNWLLEDAGGGKTKATYSIEMALGMLVPKGVVAKLVETQLPAMMDAFKRQAERP